MNTNYYEKNNVIQIITLTAKKQLPHISELGSPRI